MTYVSSCEFVMNVFSWLDTIQAFPQFIWIFFGIFGNFRNIQKIKGYVKIFITCCRVLCFLRYLFLEAFFSSLPETIKYRNIPLSYHLKPLKPSSFFRAGNLLPQLLRLQGKPRKFQPQWFKSGVFYNEARDKDILYIKICI